MEDENKARIELTEGVYGGRVGLMKTLNDM